MKLSPQSAENNSAREKITVQLEVRELHGLIDLLHIAFHESQLLKDQVRIDQARFLARRFFFLLPREQRRSVLTSLICLFKDQPHFKAMTSQYFANATPNQ